MSTVTERLALKTPEARFLHVLESEFDLSYREAREVVSAARETLGLDRPTQVQPGQVRLVVASVKASFGAPLAETARVEVTLSVDAGGDDAEVQAQQGREGLRRGRIVRILDEAVEQGGVLTEEDLARVLHVTRRTIERDVRVLRTEGHLIQTRGHIKGVGRGQTHKVRIIELWLERQGYDQIARRVHHSPQAIQRYISTFLRIVTLHQQELALTEIAFLVGVSERLVGDYVALYVRAHQHPDWVEKLEEELARVKGLSDALKRGAKRA